jgi:hypothetical protein
MNTFFKKLSDTLYDNSPSKEEVSKVAIASTIIYASVLLWHHSNNIGNYLSVSWSKLNQYKLQSTESEPDNTLSESDDNQAGVEDNKVPYNHSTPSPPPSPPPLQSQSPPSSNTRSKDMEDPPSIINSRPNNVTGDEDGKDSKDDNNDKEVVL